MSGDGGIDAVRNRIARWQHTPTNIGCRSAGVEHVGQQPKRVGGAPTVGHPGERLGHLAQLLGHLPPSAGYHPPMPLRSGETFAGFTILRLLGSGGMGEVYLVQHPRLPRRDALKVLTADLSADPEYRARFDREAEIASTLWHPHIVSVHDRGEYNGQLWISMDFVDGQDAARLLADRFPAGMPLDQVLRIVTAVASALDYAHKQGLLHRDVKPANIMLAHLDEDDEQRIMLADFGIARDIDDISGLTTTNMTVGTVAYAAPEQLMGEEIDGRADQYALAATAYHLLTGSQLFPHSNPAVVISRHLNADPPAIATTRPELAALDPVLAAALAKDPDDRFPRCTDFASGLAGQTATPRPDFAAAPTEPAPAAGKPSSPPPADESERAQVSRPPQRWLIATAVLAVTVLIGAVALVWHPWQQRRPTTTATSTSAQSPPAVSTSSATPAPPPVAAPTSAAPAPTQVITAVAVVNGKPANGYLEVPSPGNVNDVFACGASPAAVGSGIYRCAPRLTTPTSVGRPHRELCCVAMTPGTRSFIAFPTRIRSRPCSRKRHRCLLPCFWMTALNAICATAAPGAAATTAWQAHTVATVRASSSRRSRRGAGIWRPSSTVLTPCGRSKSVHSGQATSRHPRRIR